MRPSVEPERREQLIEAAARVIARSGYDAATVRDVAREAGVSTGVIAYYFEGKDDLFALEDGPEHVRIVFLLGLDRPDGDADVVDGLDVGGGHGWLLNLNLMGRPRGEFPASPRRVVIQNRSGPAPA